MTYFSRRYGYNLKDIQLECASSTLKQRVFSRFVKQELDVYDAIQWGHYTTGIEDMMIEMGVSYEFPMNDKIKQKNVQVFEKYIIESKEWYVIFDFIEKYLSICDNEKSKTMSEEFNRILQEEASAYRIVEKLVVPITNEMEIETIKEAMKTPYDPVNIHIGKALNLYADRDKPDYENSIKESISAVEAMCCIITGQTGSSATLGKTIKNLKDNGIHIHSALENAFSALYGYTSDEDGIRHGGINFNNAPAEDAKYMLVSCSAFINYLIEKKSKNDKYSF